MKSLTAAVLATMLAIGCAGGTSEATRHAAECERLRNKQDFGAAVASCRSEVETGCATYGDGAGFCGTAHLHLGMALAGTGDTRNGLVASVEFQTAEKILCSTGKRGSESCAMAQTLSRSMASGKLES